MTCRLSPKTLGRIATVLRSAGSLQLAEAVERELRPKKSGRPQRRALKEGARQSRTAARAKVRDLCALRAGPLCECGCGRRFSEFNPAEMDHALGRARAESVETCWMLARSCHVDKTRSDPSAALWLRRFICHASFFGYHAEAEQARRRLEGIVAMRAGVSP